MSDTPEALSLDLLTAVRDGTTLATPKDAVAMAAEVLALRMQLMSLSKAFVPITGENDPRAEWALRAMRGIMIENRFLAAIVYVIPDGQGGQVLRYGGAQAVVDKLLEGAT